MHKILIVDDEKQICQHLSHLLQEFGYSTGFILNPKLLFPRLEDEMVDLILLDINMPGIDGITLLQEIKDHPKFRSIPVAMLTAEDNDQILAQCFENGAEDYINKPIRDLVLKSRVQSILDARNHIREIKNQKKKEMERLAQIDEELNLAKDAQRSTLPPLPDVSYAAISAIYKPCDVVSGDTYNISTNVENDLNIFLGDGTGHGVTAAFITMMVQMGLRSVPSNIPTDEAMRQLNELLSSCIQEYKFMTGVCMRLSSSGVLRCTNAGHPSSILIPADGSPLIDLVYNGQALGMFKDEILPYHEKIYQLHPDDKIVLYTDGLIEWNNHQGEEFTLEALEAFLEENRKQKIESLIAELLEHVNAFSQETPCLDDVTVLGIQYLSPQSI